MMRTAKAFGGPAERNAVGQRRMEFFFKKEKKKKALKWRNKINRIPSKHCQHCSCEG